MAADFGDDVTRMRPKLLRFFEFNQCTDAENLVQETLSRGWRRLSEGATLYAVNRDSFYYGIARNVLFEHRRGRRREANDDIENLDGLASLRGEGLAVERGLLVDQCLDRLDPDEQRLIIEYFWDGPEQLRQRLRLSPLALRLRVHRTIVKLRALVAASCGGAAR